MEAEFAAIAAAPTRWLISQWLILLTFLLFIPAVVGLLGLLRDRWVVPGYIGGGLMLLGSYFHGAVIGFALVEVPLVQRGGQHAQLVALTDAFFRHAAFSMILLPFIGFFLGTLILALVLWQARLVPAWIAALLGAAVFAELFGPDRASPELMFVMFQLSFSWLGWRILQAPHTEVGSKPIRQTTGEREGVASG